MIFKHALGESQVFVDKMRVLCAVYSLSIEKNCDENVEKLC